MSRRAAVSLITGVGLAAGGAIILPASAIASMRQDDATPEAPPAPATPVLGEQPDGTVTWRVQAGHMSMEEMIEALAFFPNEITVNVGDRIFFDLHGFHTVTFPGEMGAPVLFVPESEALGTPAAGEGERLVANPAGAFPSGPLVHDGVSYLNSGLPDPTMPPVVIEFTQPGTFDYLCLPHAAVMKATVIVQEQGAERPHDQASYDQMAAEQMEAIIEQGRALVEQHAGPATPAAEGGAVHEVVAGVGEDQAQVLRFLPERLETAAGDTVRWTNLGVTEPHTVTFLGETAPPELILIEPQPAGPPLLVLNPEVMEPTGDPSYVGASFANSGLLLDDETGLISGVDLPDTWELTFDQPGEYPYYCVLHAFPGGEGGPALVGMVGTIVVS
jgi:plastocyanin